MPHKRKVKREHQTKLIFQPENSFLYLRYFDETDDSINLPVDSLLTVFVLKYIHSSNIKVILYKNEEETFSVPVAKSSFEFEISKTIPDAVKCCRLPVWHLPSQLTCLAGLCSVIRYAIKLVAFTTDNPSIGKCKNLLGHQLNCLSAPAEVSTWTNFCELEMPQAIAKFLTSTESYYPTELSKLETHLKQPMRIHNVRKRMQDDLLAQDATEGTDESINQDQLKLYAQERHVFAEGPDMFVSDLLLYPCVYLALLSIGDDYLRGSFPFISRWYDRMNQTETDLIMEELLIFPRSHQGEIRNFSGVTPEVVPDQSLYKCDPKRESGKTFTNQLDVERNLQWWQACGVDSLQSYLDPSSRFSNKQTLDWSLLDRLVHPQAGALPPDRLERKCHQLEGLVLPLIDIAEDHMAMKDRAISNGNGSSDNNSGCVLVDFCSGGGHLGLLLAHLLPQVTVHMVENKEESLARARERGEELGLTNVWYYQANLGYYQGTFQIGTSLHACGVATDLVIQKCMAVRAHFVCSPCCYGAVQSLDNLQYPRSECFRSKGCTETDYIMMGHTADQTHKDTDKYEQGEMFMDIVDTDRALHAQENNYTVVLSKLYPLTCSPKHNLLIATYNHNADDKQPSSAANGFTEQSKKLQINTVY